MSSRKHGGSLIGLLCLAVFTLGLAAGAVAEKPATLVRDSIPDQYKWNLSDIYPNWEAWQQDYNAIQGVMERFTQMKGTLAEGPENVLKAFKLSDSLGMLAYKVYRYPGLMSATDSRDNEVKGKLQQVQILFAQFGIAMAWFNPEMLTIPWDTMKTWLEETPDLAVYRYTIEDLYRQQEHVLSEDKEQLLSYFSQVNSAPATIWNELSTTDVDYADITLSNDEEYTLTPGTYSNILTTNRNQDDRSKAFEAFYGVFAADKNTYAAIYNGVLQVDWASAQARNYETCLKSYLDGDNVPTSVYETLIATVKDGVEPLRRYQLLRKERLGLDSYHLFDGSIPLVEVDRLYPYDSIQTWIVEAMAPLGEEYQKRLRTAFDSRWIDVYENEGKRTGAFSAGVYGVHPYMLLNYSETMRDMFTVAHELGHTMHTILADETQPFATADYTIFVAEVPSTLNEALLLDYMLKRTDNPAERAMMLDYAIDALVGTFYAQTMWADFELQMHQMVEQGQPITANSVAFAYSNLLQSYYGETLDLDSLYHFQWSRIGHFYRSPFYVYKYATCFASSAKLVQGLTSDDAEVHKEALNRYMTLLKSGGSDYPMALLKKAGVDLTQPETIQAVVTQLDNLVTQLEAELAKM
jgi:oligoendopeptidase F